MITAQAKPPAIADREVIETSIREILAPQQVTEIRILEGVTNQDRRPCTWSGYFDDPAKLAQAMLRFASFKGAYFVPNPIHLALLGRAYNKIRAVGRDPTTSDADITSRRWLLIDCDAKRPSGVSATDDEHEAALEKALAIRDGLLAMGWPMPIFADSGNGAHLLYRIDIPTVDDGLLQRCLAALAKRYDDEHVSIDQTVFNPARIWKLYGTIAGKGDADAAAIGRPQRMAKTLEVPFPLEVVSHELLDALAGPKTQPAKPLNGHSSNGAFDLDAWIARSGLEVRGPEDYQGGRKWTAPTCPWNDQHTGGSFFIIQRAGGVIQAGCHHNGCRGNDWHTLRDLFEPARYERRNGQPQRDESEAPHAEAKPATPEIEFEQFECISSAEFDRGEYETAYHIEQFLPVGQPTVLAAQLKTMKSTAAVAVAFSVATGQLLFGRFKVSSTCRVFVGNQESGAGALQETGRRLAESYGMRLSDATGLVWCQRVPRLDSWKHVRGMEKLLTENEIGLAIFDPLYFMLPGDDANNLMKQGALLREMSEMLQSIGCSSLFVHHAKKQLANPGGPLELTDISWSGVGEWARSWILLSRREPYQGGSGLHRLWCSYGGSAGHSGLIGLDIDEGISPNRHWRVEVQSPDEIRGAVVGRQSEAKEERQRAAIDLAKSRICGAAVKFPDGETLRTIKDMAGVDGTTAKLAVAELLRSGDLLPVEINKSNRRAPYDGYKLNLREQRE